MVVKKSISELPTSTVKLITATQIATSVSNIVKELVENSLDAGSTVIRVKLENSGLTKIEITDNGSGISKEDVKNMALPHYTSKITTHEDLESLVTYGFRGEALAAVCAIGKLSVITKTAEDAIALSYTMDNSGNVIDSKPTHLSQGTQVTVSSLFWNLPVRKQFYQTAKRKKEEVAKVEDLLLSYGLIHPELHLSFHHDSTLVWQKTRVSDFKANVVQTLGHSICSNMEYVNEIDPFQIFMMFPKMKAPLETCFRQKTDRCFIFINRRPVVYKEIEKLMKQLYADVQESHQKSSLFPVFLLSLRVPSDEIDVNLEPNKTQVLLKKQVEVLDFIKERVTLVIGSSHPQVASKDIATENEECSADGAVDESNTWNERKEPPLVAEVDGTDATVLVNETQFSENDQEKNPASRKSSLEVTINEEILEDDDLFYGFNEPFTAENLNAAKSQRNVTPPRLIETAPLGFPAVGSEEWAKGWARGPDGNFVHPVQVLRGEPHFAKRITDPPGPGSAAKKARMDNSFNSSFDGSQSPNPLERVNNYAKKVASDPFSEYCREKKSELLAQDPSMSFSELSQQLSQGWKKLSKRDREGYAARVAPPRPQFNTSRLNSSRMSSVRRNMTLEPFLVTQQSPIIRTAAPVMDISEKTCSLEIDFSLELLNRAVDSASKPRQGGWRCLKKLDQGGWLCSDGNEIMAVNFTRLFEVILFSRLANEYVLPSQPVTNPLNIDARTLKTQKIWDKLATLPSKYETPTTSFVVDPRVVSNGLKLRMFSGPSGSGVQVLEVPANVNNFDIGDVMKLLLRIGKEGSTVETCRPDQTVKFLEEEAARLAGDRCTEPDSVEVSTLLDQWLSSDPENVCLHGEPVVWSSLIAPSSRTDGTGSFDCEDTPDE